MQQIKIFSDVQNLIRNRKDIMVSTNPLFKTLRNPNISVNQKSLFIPFMLFFSMACPDVMTSQMMIKKNCNDISDVEARVNSFVSEDNFHYNFYLRDFLTLGYTWDIFSNPSEVIRHVFSEEGAPVRDLIYKLASFCNLHEDSIVKLTLTEILEAGLFDLFTIFYTEVVNGGSKFSDLEYYGDRHVLLEQNHTVTSWFSKNEKVSAEVSNLVIDPNLAPVVVNTVDSMMTCFDNMYRAFNKIIVERIMITRGFYDVRGTPPIDKVRTDWDDVGAPIKL
jgi:hypothetical protein